jgi:NAD+ kinase
MLHCIGVLAHPNRPQTAPIAEGIVATLRGRGVRAWLHTQWDDASVRDDVPQADAVIAIGGDGAMLKAARVCAPHGVPVLGVNMGRLGFLTEVKAIAEWDDALTRLLAGDYWIETRMMIRTSITAKGVLGDALNDVVLSGSMMGYMVQLDAYIDRQWTTLYNADGLIIATPSGSTAYALAAGGPILPPDLKNILLVPVAPHLSINRAIVMSEGSQVSVRLNPENRHVVNVLADGVLLGTLNEGETLTVRASEHSARFIRFRSRQYFYRSLLDKLEPRINRKNEGVLTDLDDQD